MIKWNEVTWYSRLGALILFIGIVPALSFYIGNQYARTITLNTISPVLNNVSAQKEKPIIYGIEYLADNPEEVSPTCEESKGSFGYACASEKESKKYLVAKQEYNDVLNWIGTQKEQASKNTNPETLQEYESATTLLQDYNQAWGKYVIQYCSLQNIPLNVIGIGGWNTSSIDCRMTQTDIFISTLRSFKNGLANALQESS
jgi:hypothetical protein